MPFVVRAESETDRAAADFFEQKVRPVLAENCYQCHSAKAEKLKGALRLDSREGLLKGGDSGAAVVPGEPDRGLLIKAVRHTDKDLAMPPGKDGAKKLPDHVIADLAQWVKMGAPFPDSESESAKPEKSTAPHWSFQTVQNPSVPEVKNPAWPRTSIDYFILAKLEERGLHPSPPAEKRALIRRATFDLTGLPPTPEEIDAFLADDSSNAFAKVVDRLLDSPQYGEHWGRHWLDIVRYADTAGDTADYPVPTAWRYRNYVIDAFNSDKPYDEFLREQIAGDILAKNGPRERYAERITATGYLALARRFGFDSENYHHLTIEDTINTVGQSVLGLSLGCARCHNHKYDPVAATEYYALYGIFESTRYSFPGSEQKGKYRALVPLIPVEESEPRWREFELSFASAGVNPPATLRSLDDMDGDFEMQKPAAGGSRGVLVPPWVYEGEIAVRNEAQSPFKNLHPFGGAGATADAGTNLYRIEQKIHPARSGGVVHVNLDFRAAKPNPETPGRHRLWVGAQQGAAAVEVFISSEAVSFSGSGEGQSIPLPKPGEWHNLQLDFDLDGRTVSGRFGIPGEVAELSKASLLASWTGALDFIAIECPPQPGGPLPALDIDNIGVRDSAIPPVSTSPPIASSTAGAKLVELKERFAELAGINGDFELQTDGAAPSAPWHPGPNSAVKISSAAQSPYRNIYPEGKLGLRLPNSGAYNGFGQNFKLRKAESTDRLYVSFDFRCATAEAGGEGNWRYYIGHEINSPAVELALNSSSFFRKSGDTRDVVQSLRVGQWYQVRLELDLKAKKYTGSISTPEEQTAFEGDFSVGWDGNINYTYIDSYGHIPGVKPALDVDNFAIQETPIPPFGAAPVQLAENSGDPGAKALELRRQIDELTADLEKVKGELERSLAEGPFEMAYAVVEGTPRNARLQMRGEPDRPGEEVPRGFLDVLGGGTVSDAFSGSGRLELAHWLTRPENPLTARVMANRLWQYHFGQGLVKTPNDFGARGQPPTHPELLDHLATEFVRNGWSMKAIHRLIMASAAYQQASRSSAAEPVLEMASSSVNAADLYNSFPRRRLTAEEIRDSILFVSGELDPSPGKGHPFPNPVKWGFSQHGPFSAVYENNQRSVYLMTQRIKRHPFLALFDGPDPNASTAERRPTTIPTQALFFLNDPMVHAKSDKFAARLLNAAEKDSERIELAHRLAFGRPPTETERTEAAEFLAIYRSELAAAEKDNVESAALAAYTRTLFGANEFLHID